MSPDERVTELELKFTVQEHQLQELSEVLWKQQREIDALQTRLALLAKKLEGEGGGLVDPQQQERPPHY
ncbi:MAG: SlyX family protein [Myxococcaceae bacterium]|nr:SlyX family protein [Myxococcaceae bacterium]